MVDRDHTPSKAGAQGPGHTRADGMEQAEGVPASEADGTGPCLCRAACSPPGEAPSLGAMGVEKDVAPLLPTLDTELAAEHGWHKTQVASGPGAGGQGRRPSPGRVGVHRGSQRCSGSCAAGGAAPVHPHLSAVGQRPGAVWPLFRLWATPCCLSSEPGGGVVGSGLGGVNSVWPMDSDAR